MIIKHKNKILIAALMLLVSSENIAQTAVQIANSTNTGTNSWGTTNFSVNGTYNAGSGAVDQFYNVGNTPLYVQGNGVAVFSNLILNNAANTIIENANGFSVNETLQSMGYIIYTPENIAGAITLGNLATLNGSTNFGSTHFVDGFMVKMGIIPFTFPLGNETIYSPITFTNPTGSALRYKAGDPGNSTDLNNLQGVNNLTSVSSKEYYIYNGNTAAGSSVTIPFNNFGNEGYAGAVSKLTLAGWNGTEWLNLGDAGNIIDLNAETVTVNLTQSLTGIQKLSLGSTDPMNVLAVSLQNFTAQTLPDCQTAFSWKINADEALQSITLEKSTNGATFTGLKTLPANSNTYTASQESGTTYYRLKITSSAGRITYSSIVKLHMDCSKIAINLSPNPVKNNLQITGLQKGYNLSVLNAAGAQVLTQQINSNVSSVNMQSFASGLYYVIISNKEGLIIEKKKIIKQ